MLVGTNVGQEVEYGTFKAGLFQMCLTYEECHFILSKNCSTPTYCDAGTTAPCLDCGTAHSQLKLPCHASVVYLSDCASVSLID